MEELLPRRISFSLKELDELGFIKVTTAKKLIKLKKLRSFKVGIKHFILRDDVLNYIEDNLS
ncbi:MAG: hypothetical protein PHY66_08105 [Aliarcobacter sp.]|nr:hypothetical protein [Aliarcobacter sp.]MDD2887752.1 hypothetical protein [Aliarcobacter sp.]